MGYSLKAITFTQGNTKKKPNEDYLLTLPDNPVCAVADGVSRSWINGNYPELSSACVAKQFCDVVTAALMQDEQSLYRAFMVANEAIAELNFSHGITRETVDYFHNDYLACVGVAGRFGDNYPLKFEYGYIGDCGILVYDANCLPKFFSENRIGVLEEFRGEWGFENKKEKDIYWRNTLRNRPNAPYMTYGTLTGEMSALCYLKTGYIDLVSGDTLILFSDGIYPFIFHRRFREEIVAALKDDEKGILARFHLDAYIAAMIPELQLKCVKNLDDDKTFIAMHVD